MSGLSSNSGNRAKILVVEDEADVRSMVRMLLAQLGEIRDAEDGAQALEIISSGFAPDVIVSDMMMPRVDGTALAKELKKNPKTAKILLVFLTAKTGAKDVIAGINAGARHYVTKPFRAEDLLGKVRKALGR